MSVVVPTLVRHAVLEQLHELHPGMTRRKQLTRSYVWWPNIEADIEYIVESCIDCAEQRRDPNAPALGRWEFASHAFHRVHIDHAGPFLGHYWLVWVDAFSKYAGVHHVSRPDSATTVTRLREEFLYFGQPDQIVSDNGPAFISVEFQNSIPNNGIQHIRSSPYHPQTNAEAERFVQTFNKPLKVGGMWSTEGQLDQHLQQFLLKYRVTPHLTTAKLPSEMFLGRRPTTLRNRFRPNLRSEVDQREQIQRRQRLDKGRKPDLTIGNIVYARFWYGVRRWRLGVLVSVAGPLSYDVQIGEEVHRRHASQLIHNRGVVDPTEEESLQRDFELEFAPQHDQPVEPKPDPKIASHGH